MKVGRNQVFPEGLDHLYGACHTGRCLEVSEVGFHRAHKQRTIGSPAIFVYFAKRMDFNRIAERGGGSMGLHVIDIRRVDARVFKRFPDDPLLGGAVGHGQPSACTILIDS